MPGGRPTKLTPAVTKAIIDSIRLFAPLHWACKRAGVEAGTLRKWRETATKGQAKRPSMRSQHERRCIEFFAELDAAEADTFAYGTGLIQAAGQDATLTVTKTTTTPSSTTTVIEKREVQGDWRAIAHLMARRFPTDMGDRLQLEGESTAEPVRTVTTDEVWDELEAYRRARAARKVGEAATANGKA